MIAFKYKSQCFQNRGELMPAYDTSIVPATL